LSLSFSHSPTHTGSPLNIPLSLFNVVIIRISTRLSNLLWVLTFLRLPPRACYIAGGHVNRASLCSWKPAQPWPCSSGRGAQPWIPSWSHSVINTEHRPLIWVETELGFPCCYF
jgi:hypothetical protein